MGGFLFGDVAWSPFAGHGGSWRDGAAAGGFPRAGRAVWGVLEWFRGGGGVSAVRAGLLARVMTAGAVRVAVSVGPAWGKVRGGLDFRGGWLGEGEGGGGGGGDRVGGPGGGDRAGGLGLAGTVPVPAGDGAVFRDLAGQRLVAGPSGADCGEDEAAGAGQGQVAAADGLPGAASLLRGSGGEGGVAGDAAGHLGGGGPGRDLLGDEFRAAGAEHRPGPRPGPVQGRLRLPQPGLG